MKLDTTRCRDCPDAPPPQACPGTFPAAEVRPPSPEGEGRRPWLRWRSFGSSLVVRKEGRGAARPSKAIQE